MMQVVNYVIGQTEDGTICIQTSLLSESGNMLDAHYISSIEGREDRQLILRPADDDDMDMACVIVIEGKVAVESGYDEALQSASRIVLVQYPNDGAAEPVVNNVPLVFHENTESSINYFMAAQCAV